MRNAAENSPRETPLATWRVALAAVQIRLRFIFAIVLLAALATTWPSLTRIWDDALARWSPFVLESPVTSGTEYFCPMDPGIVSAWPAICPVCHMDLIRRNKSDATVLPSGAVARMQISPYRVALAGVRTVQARAREHLENAEPAHALHSAGEVLIPSTAVVHWGSQPIVYVETMPGMFDGLPVQLGRREGNMQAVTSGLKPEQSVVAVGTLLIDAESRLNPHLSTQYFGASAQTAANSPPPVRSAVDKSAVEASSAKRLSPTEQQLVDAQRVCPVTGAELGSMGVPILVDVGGRQVAICCEGCRRPLLANPERYLTSLAQRSPTQSAQPPSEPQTGAPSEPEAGERSALPPGEAGATGAKSDR